MATKRTKPKQKPPQLPAGAGGRGRPPAYGLLPAGTRSYTIRVTPDEIAAIQELLKSLRKPVQKDLRE